MSMTKPLFADDLHDGVLTAVEVEGAVARIRGRVVGGAPWSVVVDGVRNIRMEDWALINTIYEAELVSREDRADVLEWLCWLEHESAAGKIPERIEREVDEIIGGVSVLFAIFPSYGARLAVLGSTIRLE